MALAVLAGLPPAAAVEGVVPEGTAAGLVAWRFQTPGGACAMDAPAWVAVDAGGDVVRLVVADLACRGVSHRAAWSYARDCAAAEDGELRCARVLEGQHFTIVTTLELGARGGLDYVAVAYVGGEEAVREQAAGRLVRV